MPLNKGKSKQAFSQNVKTEMDAGKLQKQALAIAYATKRRNKKPAGYAKGGPVDGDTDGIGQEIPDASMEQIRKDRVLAKGADIHGDEEMLHGSVKPNPEVEQGHGLESGHSSQARQPSDGISSQSENQDIVEAIMFKRQKMAEGGRVTAPAGDTDSVFDAEDAFSGHGDVDANLKENLADDTDDSDHDHDLIGQILNDRKRKRG